MRKKEIFEKVKLQGLDPQKEYLIKETNLIPGSSAENPENGKLYSGEYLMNVGLNVSPTRLKPVTSTVLEIISE